MKMAVIAVLGLLFLGGAGAGTYFFFMKPAQAAIGDTEEHKAAAEEKKADQKGGGKISYVEMAPLILPIIDKRGVVQTISLIVMVEAKDAAAAQKITDFAPRLTDAYIQDMYGALNKAETVQNGVVQVGPLKERLNAVTKKVMGEGVAQDVLLQVVQQRPI